MSAGTRRLAAIMFTDVVGFTSLGQNNEDLAFQLLEEHRGVVRSIVGKYGGTEVKTIGDAFLMEFASVLEAVRCAIEIQTSMHDRNSAVTAERRLQVRIGVHVGDIMHAGGDILGDAVNVSSRIEPLAEPGGICISEQAYDHVRNKLGLPMELLEERALKNVKVPLAVYRVVMPWEGGSAPVDELDRRRVAVLPLKNMSPDPNDEYFADGMTEELITSLSSVQELTVIARTSVMQYKTAPKRVLDIGRELHVGTVIEGSVRKAANRVRIAVQVIDAKNEGHLWAENYDKQLDDVFVVQSEVAQKVAETLKVKLADSERHRIGMGAEVDPDVLNLYLKGMFYWDKRNPEALRKAVDCFEQAVGLEPGFARGHAGLAQAYMVMAGNNYEDPAIFFPKAKEQALKALSIDEGLVEARAVLAKIVADFDRDLGRGEAEFEKAISLNPKYATAHQWYAQLLGCENRIPESWEEINRALELSPLSLIINTNVADGYYYRKDYARGIEQSKKVIEMDPNFASIYPTLIDNFLGARMYEEALRSADTYSKLTNPSDAKLSFAHIYAHMGRKEEARRMLEEVEGAPTEHVSPYFVAVTYFAIGDAEKGFEWLEKALTAKDRLVILMGITPELNLVRGDPRYLTMLGRVGLAGHIRS